MQMLYLVSDAAMSSSPQALAELGNGSQQKICVGGPFFAPANGFRDLPVVGREDPFVGINKVNHSPKMVFNASIQ